MKIFIFINSIKINMNNIKIIKTIKKFIKNEQIKYFDIYYHFVYQKIFSDCIQLNYILTNENIADDFMKLLAKSAHQLFINKMKLNLNIIFQI